MFRSALLFLFLAIPMCAQEPKPVIHVWHFNRKAFIAEVSVLGAAQRTLLVQERIFP